MGTEVKLLNNWASMYGMRAMIALAEKGVDYDYQPEPLPKKSDLLLRMNPVHKKIPVLLHNGRPICESLVIVQYIDEVWSDKAPLMPSDPHRRAQARFWANFVDTKVAEAGWKIWATKGEEQEKAKVDLIESLKVLEEQALGDKPFFGGDDFGFLDVALVPFYSWFYTYEVEGNFKVEEKVPKLVEWVKRCMERESVAKTLPDPHKVHGFVLMWRTSLGLD